jgi:hypothetical protein
LRDTVGVPFSDHLRRKGRLRQVGQRGGDLACFVGVIVDGLLAAHHKLRLIPKRSSDWYQHLRQGLPKTFASATSADRLAPTEHAAPCNPFFAISAPRPVKIAVCPAVADRH